MKKILLYFLFILLTQNISFGQEFVESIEFQLTKFDSSEIERFFTDNNDSDGYASIFIIDNNKVKLKEMKVFLETYTNDGKIEEISNPNIKNIRKIIRVRIYQCACYCNTSTYYWLITKQNEWIKIPTIEEEDYEFEMKYKDYVFSEKKPNEIQLVEFQDEFVKKDNFEIKDIKRKSEKIIKTLIWDGNQISEK